MTARPTAALSRWLAAEARGDRRTAERELGSLLTLLPAAAVPEGFAARVLAASGVASRSRAGRLWRAAVVGWLVTGFAAAWLLFGLAGGVARSGQLTSIAGRAVVAGGRALSDLLVGVDGLSRASRALTGALSEPSALLFLLICALATVMATRGLTMVIAPERSGRHV